MTPSKRLIDVSSKASIEALRVPSIEKLMQEFRSEMLHSLSPEKTVTIQKGLPVKESKIPIFADSTLLKDNRPPLAAVN